MLEDLRLRVGAGVLAAVVASSAVTAAVATPLKSVVRPHSGPHGGTLVSFEGASVELVYECARGKLTAHVLDARGKPLVIHQNSLRMQINLADIDGRPVNGAAARFALDLEAAGSEPAESGEASQFAGSSPTLQGVCQFVGNIEGLSVGGRTPNDVPFRYPGP